MTKKHDTYAFSHTISCLVMLLALVWLTVSLPYVNENHQLKTLTEQESSDSTNNLLGSSSEEKKESSTSLLSEYLYDTPVIEQNYITLRASHKAHASGLYLAYHPEMIIPPPEA